MTATPGTDTMFVGLKQTALWKTARGVKRKLLPPSCNEPLPPADCHAVLTAIAPPVALEVDRLHPWRFHIENRGSRPWSPDGSNPVGLVYRWLTYRGERFGPDTPLPLPRSVFPGEPAELAIDVLSPMFVGDYVLEVDLAQPTGGPFADRNPLSRPARVAVPVHGKRSADIDYHEVYRTANLDENHWWVVGRYHTREEYEKSSRERLATLVQHGLTPDSRVLDVGCGTGQMAEALEGYLSDRGAYSGTDIGKEAIDFCRGRFRRPNFTFRQGEMTRVPFDESDGPFDFAIFFSVFTHTFVDESAVLLAEARRLLAPTGRILADVIASDLVERGAGNRGEMVVNRDHFLRLAGMLGLTAEGVGRWPWNPRAERLMFLFRKQ
jgi:SAM-dependent methyltransferase